MVPPERVDFVKKLSVATDIAILPIYDCNKNFFYYEDCSLEELYVDKLIETLDNIPQKKKGFSLTELKSLMMRTMTKVSIKSKSESEELKDGIRKR